ncbi:methyltransferase domain-containing protein [Gramella jeungdoensis]|uniref:Methyltransferase domain-containing protein n=1 Tax=Gramella jeungdoensis TaxID=708091 RepID=A0ABT0Z2Z2_9FLAO|nr:methyltransferase domain-containing protein [Gramella jeungdoensis]MCM8570095.1 methyltransferase domain-containing protein [Gramella jeungdoensis]
MDSHSMLKPDTSRRTDQIEIMDDFELKGSELRKTLRDLEKINSWLGGNKITRKGIEKLLHNHTKGRIVKIADIGCGNGAMMRKLAIWGRKKGYSFEFVGIDANSHTIQIAEELSKYYPEISFLSLNILSDEFQKMEFDIILCTLTLHHFRDKEIISLVKQFHAQSRLGVVINDLHRSKIAYFLFQAFCSVFVNNEIARKDGLVSILRGFKKREIEKFSGHIPASDHHIKWKWAFRYQWIIM